MNYANDDKTSRDRKAIKIAERFDGFGAPASFGARVFVAKVDSDFVSIIEDYGYEGGERGLPLKETRAVITRAAWAGVAEAARKDFNARLKSKRMKSSRWAQAENKMDRMLGKELCVLAWAAEHAESARELETIADSWTALKPCERWWLYSMVMKGAGKAGDKNMGWRKAIYFALGTQEASKINTQNTFDGTLALSA